MRLMTLLLILVSCKNETDYSGKEVCFERMSGGGSCCGSVIYTLDEDELLVLLSECNNAALYRTGEIVWSKLNEVKFMEKTP